MVTKQSKLKKQAYASELPSRALSVLIYLIDRSNKEMTCFPAIPTMAKQLHISESTVKRALRELVTSGYILKSVRVREQNCGQTSNLYTLILFENRLVSNDTIDFKNEECSDTSEIFTESQVCKAEHLDFDVIRIQKYEKEMDCSPVHLCSKLSYSDKNLSDICKLQEEIAGRFLFCYANSDLWPGVEVSLLPP